MALTKVGGGIIQQPIDVGIITATSVNASGVITATSFDGNVTGDVTGNVTGNLTGNVTGNVTGNLTGDVTGNTSGTAGGLTGTPNITVGSVTATTGNFSGNLDVGGVLTYEDVTNVDAVGIVTARIGVKASNIQIGVTGGTEIDTTSGNLTLDSAGGTTTVDDYLTVTGGGNVSAGDWRFTGASNKHVTWDNSEGALEWEDNAKATFGTGNDLQIYHDGSNSQIKETGAGGLKITGGDIYLRNPSDDDMIHAQSGGYVKLYHSGSEKLETTSTGAVVTGILTATSSISGSDYEIAAIDSTISDTAVDVFIYDTSKDSDGGAWRKRTQHTSWYNETLNTATRGSRREFPAVAVIVVTAATTRKLYIYDGDDPDLPMWMVIDTIDGQWPQTESSSLYALNGIIALGSSSDSEPLYETRNRLDLYYFVSDKIESSGGAPGGSYYGTVDGLVNRRSHAANLGSPAGNSVYPLVNIRVNDVAMTVLPNAPIDDATGLPVPTIAVATDGGVSVIKDTGIVVDITDTTANWNYFRTVNFTPNYKLIINGSYNGTENNILHVCDIPSADVSQNTVNNRIASLNSRYYHQDSSIPNTKVGTNYTVIPQETEKNNLVLGSQAALNFVAENPESQNGIQSDSMVAYATTSYNTGWMHGDIKGAFLSDTDTTDAVGTELHPNGNSNFSSTDVSYISNSASGTATVTSGQLVLSGGTSNYSDHIITVSNLEVGAQYIITIDYVAKSANAGKIGFYVNGAYLNELNDGSGYAHRNAGESYSFYFTTAYSSRTIDLVTGGSTSDTHTFDNWSIKKVEEDRSVNNNGLQVFGTVPKQVVATGADLVAYGPFSHTNHLKQPYNSDLQWDGNSTWSISFWIYFTQNQAYDTVLSRQQSDGSGNRWSIQTGNQNVITFKAQGSSRVDVPGDSIHSQWRHICFTQEGGLYRSYRDGVEVGTYVGSDNFSNTSAELYIGREAGVEADHSKLALVRISNSFPSAEQVKKMYEDEKVLFQENVKCTLYGSSDAVTALAYDDDTNLLHVGTSSGRSDFQGLRRINNTTTAVTTAITAQNEFIIEQ